MGIRRVSVLGLALALLFGGVVRAQAPATNGGYAAGLREPAAFSGNRAANPAPAAKQIRRLPQQAPSESLAGPYATESAPGYDVVQASYTDRAIGAATSSPSQPRLQSGKRAIAALYDDELLAADPPQSTATDGGSVDGTTTQVEPIHKPASIHKPVAAAFDGVLPVTAPSHNVRPAVSETDAGMISSEKPLVGTRQSGIEGINPAVATSTAADNPLHRPKIIFQPIVGGVDARGNALLRPDVQLADDPVVASDSTNVRQAQYPGAEDLPPPDGLAPEMAYPVDDEWMPPVVAANCGDACMDGHDSPGEFHHIQAHLRGHPYHHPYPGVGREYVMHAPFFVDTTQPFNNCYVRTDYATDWEFPDRAEYFWAKTPGPKGAQRGINDGETRVDYQEIDFYIERGFERFSVGTRIPIRAIDPEVRLNTTGLADMEITQKLVFLDGCRWQLTQLLSLHPPTGSFRRGTGNGYFEMEPGFAWRFKASERTYFHGDLTYWFPIAADPFHSGQVLNHGIAISHVWIDADSYALIPTFEVDAWTVLDGRQTLPGPVTDPDAPGLFANPADYEEVDSLSIVNVYPGLRWVCDKGGDCSVKEFGISAGACVTNDHWYRGILRLEFRWSR